ncbi:hypothetical protein ACFLUS_02535 [Chloroflexota bacterium]
MVVDDTAVEVGDCRISKLLEALKEGMNLWVLPKPFGTIYVLTGLYVVSRSGLIKPEK